MDYFNQDTIKKILLDHYEYPTYKAELDVIKTRLKNPIKTSYQSDHCTDNLNFYSTYSLKDNKFEQILFEGKGCVISISASDLLIKTILDLDFKQVKAVLNNYHLMLTNHPYDIDLLKELNVLWQIHKQKNRIKCALIGHEAIKKALEQIENVALKF